MLANKSVVSINEVVPGDEVVAGRMVVVGSEVVVVSKSNRNLFSHNWRKLSFYAQTA